jgi:SAM-dependent methyltransferase
MRAARALGSERTAWSLRRLHCPVPASALVLEVGSGGNPYPRANVLLDAYEETRERHWAPLVADRPTVLGFVENLPFRDGAFDFVIASHVLEHSPHPERFLAELQRVARAGYIEVPDAFMERVNPYKDHRLEITERGGRLVIRKKPAWRADEELVELYEARAKRWIAWDLIPRRPFEFHVRHYWQNRIDYDVLNPQTDATWRPPESGAAAHTPAPARGVRARVLRTLRFLLSQRQRNRTLDWLALLRCPQCKASPLTRNGETIRCAACGAAYPVKNGVPRLTAAGATA